MPDRPAIEALVRRTVESLAVDFGIEELGEVSADTRLFGEAGALDSMALVNLIADLEEAVADEFGGSIVLADERAMSARQSPFRDVASLAAAIEERLSA